MKKIKLFIELLFIFLLPLILLACSFKKVKEYDENNNEISCNYQFENIFEFNHDNNLYYLLPNNFVLDDPYNNAYFTNGLIDYDNFSHNKNFPLFISFYDEELTIDLLGSFYKNDVEITEFNFVLEEFILEGDTIYLSFYDFNIHNYVIVNIPLLINTITYDDLIYQITHSLIEEQAYDEVTIHYISLGNDWMLYNGDILIVSDNAINKVLNYLYNSLGIFNNWILQFIVIYTLLWIIMWIIWHLIYLPLDFIVGIFIRKWYYEKN